MNKNKILNIFSIGLLASCLALAGCQTQTTSSEDSVGKTQILISGATRIKVGSSSKLRATVYGPTAKVTWSSSDEKVAKVETDGNVKGLTPGFVTLTATSTLSTETNPIKTSYTVLIEPDYVDSAISSVISFPWSNGLYLDGKLNYAFSSVITGSMDIKTALMINSDNTFYVDAGISSSTLDGTHVAYTGGIYPYAFSYSDETESSFSSFKTLQLSEELLAKIGSAIPSFDIPKFDLSKFDYSSINADELNKYVTFSDSQAKGIYLTADSLKAVSDKLAAFKKDYSDSTNSIISLATSLLPDSFTDVSLTVTNSTFDQFNLKIKAHTNASEDGTLAADDFTFIDFTFGKSSSALPSSYFTSLISKIDEAKEDEETLSDLEDLKLATEALQRQMNNDIYNCLNFTKDYKTYILKYNKLYQDSLTNSSNPSMYSKLDPFGPYIYFNLTDGKNTLPDKLVGQAGTTYSYSDFLTAGTDKTIDTSSYSLKLTSSISTDLTAYVTLDSENKTLTVLKVPADGILPIKITPVSLTETSLTPISFTLNLSK